MDSESSDKNMSSSKIEEKKISPKEGSFSKSRNEGGMHIFFYFFEEVDEEVKILFFN